jgi:hypothetical protein
MGQVKKLYMDWHEQNFPRDFDDDGQEQEDLRMAEEMENWSLDFDAFISRMIHSCTNARAEGALGDAQDDAQNDASKDVNE